MAETIKFYIREIGCTDVKGIDLAQKTVKWHALPYTVMLVQVP
jgi:hypothetical protein